MLRRKMCHIFRREDRQTSNSVHGMQYGEQHHWHPRWRHCQVKGQGYQAA